MFHYPGVRSWTSRPDRPNLVSRALPVALFCLVAPTLPRVLFARESGANPAHTEDSCQRDIRHPVLRKINSRQIRLIHGRSCRPRSMPERIELNGIDCCMRSNCRCRPWSFRLCETFQRGTWSHFFFLSFLPRPRRSGRSRVAPHLYQRPAIIKS